MANIEDTTGMGKCLGCPYVRSLFDTIEQCEMTADKALQEFPTNYPEQQASQAIEKLITSGTDGKNKPPKKLQRLAAQLKRQEQGDLYLSNRQRAYNAAVTIAGLTIGCMTGPAKLYAEQDDGAKYTITLCQSPQILRQRAEHPETCIIDRTPNN